ncbi:MAG: NAD-dependent epimerase/dehydratase family protein [Myxococcota bacterium]|nr:NAD-dependent epimerase/dehydratase family protein [Myxococcota bacterium]
MAKRRKKKKTVLVTGASGFLGYHVVQELLCLDVNVRTLSRRAEPRLADLGVEQYQGSVTDQSTCMDALDGIDQVYHLAGTVARSPADSGLLYDVHVTGTRNILAACLAQKINDVVCVSTSGTVGVGTSSDFEAHESSPVPWSLIGRWPYYESKALAEREIAHFVEKGLPVRIARPTLLLGPGDYNASSTGDVARFLSGEIKAALPGGMSLVDVRDVAAALPNLMTHGVPGVGYLMGAANCTIRDFLVGLEQVSAVRAPAFTIPNTLIKRSGGFIKRMSSMPVFGGLDRVTFEMGCHFWYINWSRARDELGFIPREWTQTLADTVADIRSIGRH